MPSKLSLPQLSLAKDKIKVLLLEGVNDSAVELIEAAGYSSMTRLSKALEGDALKEAIKGVREVLASGRGHPRSPPCPP